jgi:hypothetical protein
VASFSSDVTKWSPTEQNLGQPESRPPDRLGSKPLRAKGSGGAESPAAENRRRAKGASPIRASPILVRAGRPTADGGAETGEERLRVAAARPLGNRAGTTRTGAGRASALRPTTPTDPDIGPEGAAGRPAVRPSATRMPSVTAGQPTVSDSDVSSDGGRTTSPASDSDATRMPSVTATDSDGQRTVRAAARELGSELGPQPAAGAPP